MVFRFIADLERVWEYSYTTVPQTESEDDFFTVQSRMGMQKGVGGPIAGLGFGLPMSRIYGLVFHSSQILWWLLTLDCSKSITALSFSGLWPSASTAITSNDTWGPGGGG